ncbi:MAG: DUF2461 domain-containing protein [Magnetospirillum sp.]|nr:DUF2461 domain-containing protein [Magnetospirillum sp.]
MGSDEFAGIPAAAFSFLAALAANNERAWFEAHRGDCDTLVRQPLRRLVEAMAPTMRGIDPALDTDPRGGAVSRIHRDTRFSHDKSPYRVNQWIAFKRPGPGWQDRPAFFVEFGPAGWRHGMGCYAAAPAAMAALRQRIVARPAAFLDALGPAWQAGYVLAGERYKRTRLPADCPAALRDLGDRKSPYLECCRPIEAAAVGGVLVEDLCRNFAAATPLYRLLSAG